MLEEIDSHVAKRDNFAFETTLSGRHYARILPDWQAKGYQVKLVFLRLADVKLAIERVRVRVKQGGHNVPEDVNRRRYESGWRNFENLYKDLVDYWLLYDNSGTNPILIDAGGKT
jgi:predicted ABC-type ATPase